MKVLAMTLRRVPQRGEYIEQHLRQLHLDYELIDCVDFKDYTPAAFSSFYNKKVIAANKYLTMGVIGCTLSHLKIYEKIVNTGLPYAFIIEDDVVMPQNIGEILSRLETEIKADEIIAVSYHNRYDKISSLSNLHKKPLTPHLQLVYPVHLDEIASTMGYVVTLAVARRMLKINRPVYLSSDYWADYYAKGAFTSFRCLYPILIKPAKLKGTIEYPAARTLFGKFASWIRQRRIPVLLQILEKRRDKILDKKYSFRFTNELPYQERFPPNTDREIS
jgi:glycosyl transferase family 25